MTRISPLAKAADAVSTPPVPARHANTHLIHHSPLDNAPSWPVATPPSLVGPPDPDLRGVTRISPLPEAADAVSAPPVPARQHAGLTDVRLCGRRARTTPLR
ncbi:hypothetical protein ACIO91_13945, partial [Streptomyces sp. NPDC087294]